MVFRVLNTSTKTFNDLQLRNEDDNSLLVQSKSEFEVYELKDVKPVLYEFILNQPEDREIITGGAKSIIKIASEYDGVILPDGTPALLWTLGRLWPTCISYLFFIHLNNRFYDFK